MAIIRNRADFDAHVLSKPFVLLEFRTDNCDICDKMDYALDQLLEANPDIAVERVNLQTAGEMIAAFNIRTLPTVFIIRHQMATSLYAGLTSKEEIQEGIDYSRNITRPNPQQV